MSESTESYTGPLVPGDWISPAKTIDELTPEELAFARSEARIIRERIIARKLREMEEAKAG